MGLPSLLFTHVRTLVPLSKCEEAASYLISALGGEEVTKRLIGGVKWWQGRGVNGSAMLYAISRSMSLNTFYRVDAEWIYDKDIDGTRCILYLHGGEHFVFMSCSQSN